MLNSLQAIRIARTVLTWILIVSLCKFLIASKHIDYEIKRQCALHIVRTVLFDKWPRKDDTNAWIIVAATNCGKNVNLHGRFVQRGNKQKLPICWFLFDRRSFLLWKSPSQRPFQKVSVCNNIAKDGNSESPEGEKFMIATNRWNDLDCHQQVKHFYYHQQVKRFLINTNRWNSSWLSPTGETLLLSPTGETVLDYHQQVKEFLIVTHT